jgi:ATP-dependent protease HslVU (ClpYQ) peptidase subunit
MLQCGESYIGVCGSAAHHLVLANLLGKMPDLQLTSKAGIFETFRKLHPVLKEECFLNPKEDKEDPYDSSQITALIANASGIYGTNIPGSGPRVRA